MAFESLSDKLQNIFKNLRGKGRLSEADVKAALKGRGIRKPDTMTDGYQDLNRRTGKADGL